MNKLIPNSFQTPNAYVDDYMALLTPAEWVVLSYMARRIFGFQKQLDRISLSQFTEGIIDRNGDALDYGTGLHHAAVRKALAALITHCLVLVVDRGNAARHIPPAYALQLDQAQVDRVGLEQRAAARSAAQQQRTAAASARRRGTSDDIRRGTSDDIRMQERGTSDDTRRGTSDDTRRGTSDVPTKPRGNPEETKGDHDDDDDMRGEAPQHATSRRSSSSSNPPAARAEHGDEADKQPPQGTNTPLTERGTPQPPIPPGPLPPALEQAAAEWLGHALPSGERKVLLSLLGDYGASWLEAGIAASVAQGGKSLSYLREMLRRCRANGTQPGDPKPPTTGEPNGTHQPPGSARRGPSQRPLSPPPSGELLDRIKNARPLRELMAEYGSDLRGLLGGPPPHAGD